MLGWMKQAGIKISWRTSNNLRYADDTTLMAESEEELKSLLKLEPIIQSEVSQKEKHQYSILTYTVEYVIFHIYSIYMEFIKMVIITCMRDSKRDTDV